MRFLEALGQPLQLCFDYKLDRRTAATPKRCSRPRWRQP